MVPGESGESCCCFLACLLLWHLLGCGVRCCARSSLLGCAASLIDSTIDAPAKSHESHSELAHYPLHITGLHNDLLKPVIQCGGQV